MAKRSTGKFKRRPQDKYFTPPAPMRPLYPHLEAGTTFCEPCAGNGRLVGHMELQGYECKAAYDIKPQDPMICKKDALTLTSKDLRGANKIITNPPWTRELLIPMIDHFRQLAPTWLLLDADFMHIKLEALAKKHGYKTVPELMQYCHKIVSVGRVSWMENGLQGKDNACWYLFKSTRGNQQFIPRC